MIIEKRSTQMSVNITFVITGLILFSSVFLMGGGGFYRRVFMKEQTLVGKPLFVCVCASLCQEGGALPEDNCK